MKGIKTLLRERRARSRMQQYDQDGIDCANTSNGDFDTLLHHVKINVAHRPLVLAYRKSMENKLTRTNSYLTFFLDDDKYLQVVWWVWRDAQGHYVGLTRYEFSDNALKNTKIEGDDFNAHVGLGNVWAS
jgi:hypothetical protein